MPVQARDSTKSKLHTGARAMASGQLGSAEGTARAVDARAVRAPHRYSSLAKLVPRGPAKQGARENWRASVQNTVAGTRSGSNNHDLGEYTILACNHFG